MKYKWMNVSLVITGKRNHSLRNEKKFTCLYNPAYHIESSFNSQGMFAFEKVTSLAPSLKLIIMLPHPDVNNGLKRDARSLRSARFSLFSHLDGEATLCPLSLQPLTLLFPIVCLRRGQQIPVLEDILLSEQRIVHIGGDQGGLSRLSLSVKGWLLLGRLSRFPLRRGCTPPHVLRSEKLSWQLDGVHHGESHEITQLFSQLCSEGEKYIY